MYVLHDVTFECDGNKAQIDYLIFTRGLFYLIECKNLIGNITIDSNGQFYREYECNNKKVKESIYSPYTQAIRHQDMLKKVWSINHNKLDNLIFGELHKDNFFKTIVVLANSKCILNKKYAPKEMKNSIIRADQLIELIQKDINSMDRFELLGEKKLREIAEIWLSRSISNDSNMADKYLKQISGEANKIKLRN